MAESEALIGYGITVELSTDGGSNYAFVGEITNVSPPGFSLDTVDVTHTSSPEATREFIAGLIDRGEMSCDINWIPGATTDTLLSSVAASRARIKARLTFPTTPAKTFTFSAVMTGFAPAAPLDDRLTAAVTFKVSGPVVVA